MDRLASVAPRVLVALLSGLALVAVSWLTLSPGPPCSGEDAFSAATVCPEESPAETAVAGVSARPELFHPAAPSRRLPPPCSRTLRVLATGFPGEPDTRAKRSPPPAAGRLPVAASRTDAFQWRMEEPWAQPVLEIWPRLVQLDEAAAGDNPAPSESSAAGQQPPRALDRPAGSPLFPPESSTKRSIQLERIARQADKQIRHGFELAGRGAYFAARAEFIRALWLVTQGLNAEHQTVVHSRALSAGLTALKEAEDFIPDGSRLEAELDIATIIGGHRTPVLKNAEADRLAPLSALKCYFTFAQEQLGVAGGREVAGSMALHSLGKLHAALAGENGIRVRAAEPKAMAFYQAALLVYPRNHMASNDLGVLLARRGDYQEARAVLEHSLSMHGQSTGWHNLAVVYQQLGQVEMAQRAQRQAEAARGAETALRKARKLPANQSVRWVDPETFAKTYARTPDARQPMPVRPKSTLAKPNRPVSTKTPTPAKKKSIAAWRWPWDSI